MTINEDVLEDYSALAELDNLFNEAWTNGYVDGYVSVIRKQPDYCEHSEGYEGRLLEEYESGYNSAIRDNVKWTRKYAWARGYIDGLRTSKLEWNEFDFLAFWANEYTGELLNRYNDGYYAGFFENYSKQRDYEWALGFLNQLRNLQAMTNILPRIQLFEKNHHDDHGYLHYPFAYEEGYEKAKTFCQYNTIAETEKTINFTKKIQWIIGFIDGKYHRKERFGYSLFDGKPNYIPNIFDENCWEYNDGYKAGSGDLIYDKVNKGMSSWEYNSCEVFVERSEVEIRNEVVWGTGYVDGRMYGILKYRGYNNAENEVYKEGYDVGYSESKQEKSTEDHNASMFSLSNSYINNKLEAWKLGVKSGLTGNSARPNNSIFVYSEDNSIYSQNDNSFARNMEFDLYNSYKEGCRFGYEHTFFYKWDIAYDAGFSDGEGYAYERANANKESRSKFRGYELEAYDKGFSDAIDFVEKSKKQADDFSSYEWTMEDSWDAMTDGMYGDYEGDVDFDKFGL